MYKRQSRLTEPSQVSVIDRHIWIIIFFSETFSFITVRSREASVKTGFAVFTHIYTYKYVPNIIINIIDMLCVSLTVRRKRFGTYVDHVFCVLVSSIGIRCAHWHRCKRRVHNVQCCQTQNIYPSAKGRIRRRRHN